MSGLLLKTLSEIVNEQPRAASVFDKYDLDYCCKVKRSLQEACAEKNVPVNDVIQILDGIFSARESELEFSALKLFQLIDYVMHTHHSYVRTEAPLLLSRLERMAALYGHRNNELFRISALFFQISCDMNHQMYKEETVLFPVIRQLEQNGYEPIAIDNKMYGYLQAAIKSIEHRHNHSASVMAVIKKLANNYTAPQGNCTRFNSLYANLQAFENDMHKHMELEHKIVFQKALNLEKEIKLSTLN